MILILKELYKDFINTLKSIDVKVWFLLFIALILRLYGVNFGLPLYLNTDEPATVSSTLALQHNLNPGHFDWPHLYFYTMAVIFAVFSGFRFIATNIINLPDFYESTQILFLISRSFNAVLGAITLIPIYILTRKMYGDKIALIASVIFTFLPVHVYESHFAKPDVYQTLITAIAFIFVYNIYLDKNISIKNYIFSGMMIGFATSIKYGGVLIAIPFIIAVILNSKRSLSDYIVKLKYSFVAALTSVVCFFIGTPFAIPDFNRFFSNEERIGALWQIKNVGSLESSVYPEAVFEKFFVMYNQSLGVGVWIFFIALILLFLFFNLRNNRYYIYLLPTIFLTFYISKFDRSPQHYFVFLIPFYIPVLSNFIYSIIFDSYDKIIKFANYLNINANFIKNKKLQNVLSITILLVVVAPSIYSSFNASRLLAKKDTRTIAYEWINTNLNAESDKLYIIGAPFDMVQFDFVNVTKLTKLDVSQVDADFPLYVLVGEEQIKKSALLEGDRDPVELKGNSESLLKEAELVFFIEDEDRLGPPVFIFKVTHFSQKVKD